MKQPNKTVTERLVHALTFELVAIALCAPVGAWLLDMPVSHVGALTVMVSLIAMAWNMTFNTLFDRLERRFGWVRNLGMRIVHAVAFELGLVAMVVPLAAWWLGVGLLEASADSSSFWLRRGYARTEGARGGTRWHITRDGWLWLRATATYPIWTSLHAVRDDDVPWPDGASPVGPVWRECRRWRCLRQAAGPGYIVCGDAASHLDPATGDGLRFAMASGLRAGALAADVLHHPHRSSVLSALYSDWVVQTYEGNRALLARHYALSGLDIGARDPLLLPDA